jgi:Flp pilus assembly protein TadG
MQNRHLGFNQEVGSTLIEFAFVLMILLMLTFAMIDLSRAVYAANVVQMAAQIGARAGIVDMAAVTPAVQNRLIGLDPARAQVTATLVSNERVEVEVTYEFELVTPFLSQVVEDGVINLSGSASMLTH